MWWIGTMVMGDNSQHGIYSNFNEKKRDDQAILKDNELQQKTEFIQQSRTRASLRISGDVATLMYIVQWTRHLYGLFANSRCEANGD